MVKIGIDWLPTSARGAVEVARATEEGGFWGLGISDSPILFSGTYPVATACLLETKSIKLGALGTNPVTRHWTVHAANLRAWQEMAPGRSFVGIASGFSAVHTIGLRPATVRQLEGAVRDIRQAAPGVAIHVGASGPRMAEMAGRTADAIIIGTGTDPIAIRNLYERALSARKAAGVQEPLEAWSLVTTKVVESESEVEAARKAVEPVVIPHGYFSLDFTFEGKNVPEEFQQPLRERFAKYDFLSLARISGGDPNVALFADRPDLVQYLLDRFSVVGTPEMCAEKLRKLLAETAVSGIWLAMIVVDPVKEVKLAAETLLPTLS